jgi:hypothetical protein
MADNKLLQQMLESLVNDDQAKAEELFHEYVVAKSREIYEGLIESEISEEEDKDDEEDEEMEEAASDEEAEEDQVDENFEDIAIEADDEMADMGGDATDDLEADLDADMEDEGEEKSEEELFQDLDAIVDELQAKFDELKGDDEGEEMGDDEGNPFAKEDTDLETVREYVEKVAPAKMGDNGANAKSIVAGKNDMGGTTANIAKGGESKSEGTKGGLLNPATKEENAGNINVPGGKAGSAFSTKEPGHGAEKAGAKESADNKQSIFRGRR